MAQVVVTMSADEARLWKAQERIYQQQLKVERKFESTARVSKKAGEAVLSSNNKQEASLKNVTTKVGEYALSYATVSTGVQAVTEYLRNQIELQKEALELAKELGKAQQEASKNLTGFTTAEKAAVFETAGKLQAEVGFPDLPKLQEALGQVTSLTGGNLELAKRAVAASAEINLLTPEGLAPLAAAIADVSKATGVEDVSKVSGFILETQAASHIRELGLLAKNITPVLATATGAFGGDDATVAREAAALFAHLSQKVADDTGERTKTANVQFLSKLDGFFDDLPNFRQKQQNEIETLTAKQRIDEGEQLSIDKAQFDLQDIQKQMSRKANPRTDEQKAEFVELQLRERELRLRLKNAQDRATLTEDETSRLATLRSQQAEIASLPEATTPMERISALQASPALRDEFLSSASFGEESFRQPVQDLLTSGTAAAAEIARITGGIKFNKSTFEAAVTESQEGITPQQAIAISAAKRQGRQQIANSSVVAQVKASVREEVAEALKRTRENNAYGLLGPVTEFLNTNQIASASSADEAYRIGIEALQRRDLDLQFNTFTGTPSESDREKRRIIERAISGLREEQSNIEITTSRANTATATMPQTTEASAGIRDATQGSRSQATQLATSPAEVKLDAADFAAGVKEFSSSLGALSRVLDGLRTVATPTSGKIDEARQQAAQAARGD